MNAKPPTALETFQASHFGPRGILLTVDDELGPETRWAQAFVLLHPDQQAIIGAALRFHLLREQPAGSNRHPVIDQWIDKCHVARGSSWCAAGLSECLSAVREIRIAGALELIRHLEAIEEPEAACGFSYPTDLEGHGHCGVVTGVSDTEVMTFEFNVDSGASWGRRSRKGLKFGRWARSIAGAAPPVVARAPFRAQVSAGTR